MADLQLGKADGDGTDGTIARFFSMLETAAATCDRLASRGVEELVIPWLGDLVENVDGHYAMQGFTTDRNLNEQVETAALLYLALNKTLAPMFPRVLNVVVPGNHGEVRKDGKAHTDFGDNHDVTAPYLGHQAITDTLPHVRFLRPSKPDLTATVEIRGRIHGFMHGHQGKVSGPTAHARIIEWHRRQAAGQRAMGDAEFVWSAHYHHASIAAPNASRVYIQSPALDGGSPWYAETKGDESEPGTFMGLLNGKRGMAGSTGSLSSRAARGRCGSRIASPPDVGISAPCTNTSGVMKNPRHHAPHHPCTPSSCDRRAASAASAMA
jgi:hypothetical protein